MGDHQLNKPMNSCSLCGQCSVVCPNGFDMAQVCHRARQNMVSTDKMPLAPHEFALMDMLFSNGEAFLNRTQPGYARAFLLTELAKLGDPVIIAGCPSCAKELRESVGGEIVGIWDILEEIGLPEGARDWTGRWQCTTPAAPGEIKHTQEAIRSIAGKLGMEITETEYSGDRSPCCGYGGLTAYANKEVAHEMTDLCLSRSDAPYVTYCMACRDRFAREGRESRHILELVYGTDAGTPPDISEKRYNRMRLKNDLLRELWNEEVYDVGPDYDLAVYGRSAAADGQRMILKDDVIGSAE